MMGCSPGWGCEAVINHQNKAFDLEKTVEVSHGNYAAMMADTITRFKEGKPILYYTWTPYWVSDVMKPGKDVVWLQVPFSSLPGEQKDIDTKLPNGANYGFPVNTMHIVANKAWAEKNPAAAKLFAVMKLPLADINAQNAMMHDGKASEADVQGHVDGWIKAHQQQFDGWVKKRWLRKNNPLVGLISLAPSHQCRMVARCALSGLHALLPTAQSITQQISNI